MSEYTKYYSTNLKDNPYTMEATKNSSRVKLLESLIREHIPQGGKILDVGCGDMWLSKMLPEYDWIGVDCNLTTNEGKAIRHDLESVPYPFKAASFDGIVCSEVLEHIFDPVKVTKEISRLLKPSGTYLVSTPNLDFIDHFVTHFRALKFDIHASWTKEHIHQYNIESHDQILAEAGLKRIFFSGADPHGGAIFTEARIVLAKWVQAYNRQLDETESLIQADLLLSEMFKLWLHTILIVARKA